MGHRPGHRGGHTDWGLSVTCSLCLGGQVARPQSPLPPPGPQLCLQALGQLRLVADGAGTTMQAVTVAGQAAGCYLAVRAAVGRTHGAHQAHVYPRSAPCPTAQHPGLCLL